MLIIIIIIMIIIIITTIVPLLTFIWEIAAGNGNGQFI